MSFDVLLEDPKVRRILECGERCAMQIHPVATKKPVFQGLFRPPAYVDWSYFPDPSKDSSSEWNAMQKLVALGFYERTAHDFMDSHRYEWRATERGRQLIAALKSKGFKPQRNPHQ